MNQVQHLDKRLELIAKRGDDRNYIPTKQELEEAYGYLDWCLVCNKRIKFYDAYSHGSCGNTHKFGCGFFAKAFGKIYFVLSCVLKIVCLPLLLIMVGIEYINNWRKNE